MIDLTAASGGSHRLHRVSCDPGRLWWKAAAPALDAPPDDDPDPPPDARWTEAPRAGAARRGGVSGVVSPRVVRLPDGSYRVWYTQILPRPGFPAGANDYENSTARILSAVSTDGAHWTPEPGVRMSARQGGAGEFRVASSEVVPLADGRWRMCFECCPGSHAESNSIRSAVSDDGLEWTVEPGVRIEAPNANFASPRIVFLPDGGVRLYLLRRGVGIVSAVSHDGLSFRWEPGVRIAPGDGFDALIAFAPDIVLLDDAWVMYYAAYRTPSEAFILRATSADGIEWRKETAPAISPGPGGWDAAKCSEMCLFRLPKSDQTIGLNADVEQTGFGMLYEACDGTAPNARGVWRIAAASNRPIAS